MNYYLTSDRFLDERVANYPAHLHGGNGRDRYADVETVRVAGVQPTEHAALLRELWQRYRLPLAITEVHMGCTREQQLRWLLQAWRAACSARAAGIDVRAVTPWSAFGAFDWHRLVTQLDGFYEPGLFDVRAREPRPTALAHMTRELARDGECRHPAARGAGWWVSAGRALYPAPPCDRAVPSVASSEAAAGESLDLEGRPILVAGAGTLGRAFARIAEQRGLSCRLMARRELDIADADAVQRAIELYEPWALINAAGYVDVDAAEREPERCFRENVIGPSALAEVCRSGGIPLVTFSSDLVFNGRSDRPYVETDAPDPLGLYGRTKAEAETRVLDRHDRALVVRTAAFFGPWDEANFVVHALRALAAGQPLLAASDLIVSPTYVPDLVHATLDLVIDGEHGIWHVANGSALSWADLARAAAAQRGLDPSLVQDRISASLGLHAPRPAFSALTSARGTLLRPLEDALAAMMLDWRAP
jgi:dTDP-4-dehydrorhamnose reductase